MTSVPLEIDVDRLNQTIRCYAESIYRFNGVWEGPDPLTPLISLFLVQLTISMAVIHGLVFAFKPFNQPPFVAEVIGGMLLGPSALGRITVVRKILFPNYSFKVLEPMAHLGIVYYAFLVGLKMDVRAIFQAGPKPVKIAVGGALIPFAFGLGLFFMNKSDHVDDIGCIFWAAALTITSYSVLTKILEKQQMIHTEIGKTILSSALINDMFTWGYLILAFTVSSSPSNNPDVHWNILSTIAFVLLCIYYGRPGLSWIVRKTPTGQGYSEFYLCSLLAGMGLSGVMTDMFGTHPMIGAFIFGLMIPNEVLEATLVDKLEDFVVGILMPVYFVVCGLRTNIDSIFSGGASWLLVLFVIVLACGLKVVSTVIVSIACGFSFDESMAMGVLSNAKGVMVLFILEAGQVQGVLNTQSYSLMVFSSLLMTIMATPASSFFKPKQGLTPYKRRTVQKASSEEELRVLACIYNTRNVPTLINLLRTSSASTRSPISVFALQLVELVGRATTMMVVHEGRKAGPRNPSHIEAQADQIIAAFDNYELRSEGVRTQTITARCAYATMHEDICRLAKEKHVAIIITPFHKQQNLDGEMEDINPSIRETNEGILAHAPCSVGILVDKGSSESHDHSRNVAVLFFGGPDDREALSYAWRMVDNPEIRVKLVRFIPSKEAEKLDVFQDDANHVSLEIDLEREKILDDEYLNKFKNAAAENKSLSYYELVLNDEEETVKAIKSMDDHKHDLYIVGRGQGFGSPLTSGLADWCDCPELGPIGDLFVTSEFESSFSVLIVQQYVKTNRKEGSVRSSSMGNYTDEVAMRQSVTGSDGFEDAGSFKKWEHDD